MLPKKEEFTGKDVNYYLAEVPSPKRLAPYTAECEDIIEALGMTFSEGCAFKAIWRSCAARNLGKFKQGMDIDGIYDAEKIEYYGARTLAVRKRLKEARLAQENLKTRGSTNFAPIFDEIFTNMGLKPTIECDGKTK